MGEQGFTLTSPDFGTDSPIPRKLTCDGANNSPALEWMHPPKGTQSFALIVDDPDAPDGTFTHWVLFDIPADAAGIPTGGKIGTSGRNDFQQEGYGGPCPPPNHGDHRYFFKLFALDVESLDLDPGARKPEVENAMKGHILDQTELMGRYRRDPG